MANFMNPEYNLIEDFKKTYGTPLEIKEGTIDIKTLEKLIKPLNNWLDWSFTSNVENKEIEESIRTTTGLQFKTMKYAHISDIIGIWDETDPYIPDMLRCFCKRYQDGVTLINVFTYLDYGQVALINFEHKIHCDGAIFRAFIFNWYAVKKSITIARQKIMEVSKETKAMYPSYPMYSSTPAARAACAEYDAVAENKSAAKRAAANKRAALAELADAKEAMMLAEEKYNTAKAAAAVAASNAKEDEMADNPDYLLCGLTAQLAEDAAIAASEAEKMYNVAKAVAEAVVIPAEGANPYRICICGTDNECVKNGDCSACLANEGLCDNECGVTHCYISSLCSDWNIYLERCNPSSPAQYCHCK